MTNDQKTKLRELVGVIEENAAKTVMAALNKQPIVCFVQRGVEAWKEFNAHLEKL